MPQHYGVNLVKKGSKGFEHYPDSGTVKTHEKLESSVISRRREKEPEGNERLLRTGVEHWKSSNQKNNEVLSGELRSSAT